MKINVFTKQHMIKRTLVESVDWKNVEVATILNPDLMEIKKYLKNLDLKFDSIDFNGTPCCVVHRNLKFYSEPKKALSPGSNAKYIAHVEDRFVGLLLQYLPPKSATSKHYHKKRIEDFHNLEGKCVVECNDRQVLLAHGDTSSTRVHSFDIHQVKTTDSPALTLLEMLGSTDMKDHYYVK